MALYFILGVISGIVFTVLSTIAILACVARALDAENKDFQPKF